ncbi:MAG: hypothetical protein CMB14_04305 [Euryarchaeota archaeon]|nr:hypothetical protein [Euryarchaeota archaeon]
MDLTSQTPPKATSQSPRLSFLVLRKIQSRKGIKIIAIDSPTVIFVAVVHTVPADMAISSPPKNMRYAGILIFLSM